MMYEEIKQKSEHATAHPELDAMARLAQERERRHITQKELADAAGLSQGDISKLERGKKVPTVKTLKRLAGALDLEMKISFVKARES